MRVLVADESATLRDGAAQALQAAGHEVVCAEDGLSAWQSSLGRPFDAAFISPNLAHLDGLQLLSLWRQQRVAVGAVVMLADAGATSTMKCWSALTSSKPDLLRKPFAPALLVDLLESLEP